MFLKQGKKKATTFSYADGVTQGICLIKLLNKNDLKSSKEDTFYETNRRIRLILKTKTANLCLQASGMNRRRQLV